MFIAEEESWSSIYEGYITKIMKSNSYAEAIKNNDGFDFQGRLNFDISAIMEKDNINDIEKAFKTLKNNLKNRKV